MIVRKDLWTSRNGNRQSTKYIVIHHAGAVYRPGDAVRAIYTYHKNKWPSYNAAGYHIICQLENDNTVKCYLVNPHRMQAAGVAYRNHETFHICLAWNFLDSIPHTLWIDAARQALRYATKLYPKAEIVGHRDIALSGYGTACPGNKWHIWKNYLKPLDPDPSPGPKPQPEPNRNPKIIGNPTLPMDIFMRVLNERCGHLPEDHKEAIAAAYFNYGSMLFMGNLYPFAQAIHETGWFTSERFRISNNPAGLGATDDGAWGETFFTIGEGVLAQYAHLLCYAKPYENLVHIQRKISELSPRRDALISAYGLGAANNLWKGLTNKWNTPSPEGSYYADKILDIAELIQKG